MSTDARDAVSAVIDEELFRWLEETAATAETDEQFVDLYAGAVCGLSRFLWTYRREGTSIDTIVNKVAGDVRCFLTQANDIERGGMA